MKKQRLPVNVLFAMAKFSCFHLFIVMLTFGISLAEETNAQELLSRPVSVNISNQDVRTALMRIGKSADVKFSYDPALIRNAERITLSADQEPLGGVLDKILDPMRLTYSVSGKYIILTREQAQGILKMRGRLAPLTIPAAITVTGRVTDAKTGDGLPGVSVLVKGTQRGTSTDQNGRYDVEVSSSSTTLVFSFVGYEPIERVVGNATTLDVTLAQDEKLLNEVVVVGYGTQGRGELTVSVSQVKGKELQDVPQTNFTEALAGRAAGVDVVTGSGAPGAGSKIRIRGANSVNSSADPLIVIDGFPVAASSGDLYANSRMGVSGDRTDILSMINPNDIESIEILKDAGATSIYGARGANGVILITTKSGRTGSSGISVRVNTGIQQMANSWDLMNANQFSELLYDAYDRGGVDMENLAFNPSERQAIPTDYNTNWLDEVLRTGSIQDYSLTFNGASDKTNYSGSVGYLNNQGLIKSNFYKRYSARFNADSKAWNDKVRFGLNTNLSYVDQKAISNNRVFDRAMQIAPNYPVRFPSGRFEGWYTTSDGVISAYDELWGNNYGVASSDALNLSTPYLDIDIARAPINTARMIANGFVSVEPIKGLVLKSAVGTDLNFTKMKFLIQNVGPFRPTGGSLEHKQSQTYSWLVENTATYTKQFGQHSVTALVGQSGQKFHQEGLGIAVEEADPGNILVGNNPFYVDGFQFNNGQQDHLTDSHKFADVSEWTVASYFGRLNYAYEDRYLLTATVRRDGSSKFGKESKWGVFPGLSAAWNLHNEDFFNVPSLNLLKLRGSWGIVGNQGISNFQSQGLLRSIPSYIVGVIITGTSTAEAGLADPALSWESTRQVDIGIDARIFNRFNITTDMYWKKTSDLLYGLSLPSSTGFTGIQTTNLGSLEQVGFEFSISGDVIQGKNTNGFNWFASLNMDHLTGKVTELPPNNPWVGDRIRSYLNEPIGTLYGYKVDGIYNSQSELDDPNNPHKPAQLGDYKYQDLGSTSPTGEFLTEPDGRITAADRTDLGNVNPILSLGFNNTFNYKNFDLTLFFRGSFGNKIYNEARRNLLDTRGERNTITEALDRWTPTNNSQTIQAANSNRRDPTGSAPISIFVEDGSYLRLQNLTFGYTLPTVLGQRIGIKNMRLYTSINNLFVLTGYQGLDPEVSGDDTLVPRGVDNSTYPRPRVFSLGLNLGF